MGERLADFVPDGCGLDIVDRTLLAALAHEWQAVQAIVEACRRLTPPGHRFSDALLRERLLEISGLVLSRLRNRWLSGLVEVRFDGGLEIANAEFRLLPLGAAVRDGRVTHTKHQPLLRWVGGRLIER
jgi:hypothetical protein